jgi:hypothetical protein
MAIEKDVNCYVDLDEATAHLENRLDVAAWDEANDEMKSKALISATMLLDSLDWTGIVVSESQPLAFPRVGEYFDPRIGYVVTMSGVPQRIITANIELAYHLLNNDGLLDDTGSVESLSLGPIQLNRLSAPSKIPSFIYRSLRPLLANSGSRSWWRAN